MTVNLKPGQRIAGFPALTVRHLFRRMRVYDSVTRRFVAEVMGVSDIQARKLLEKLDESGYISKKYHRNGVDWWELSDLGVSLSLASGAKRISRKAAETALAAFMLRVQQMNDDDYYSHKVTAVVLYGSFLSDREDLGDVDIVVELKGRASDPQLQAEIVRAKIEQGRAAGRDFSMIIREICWPEDEVFLFLKHRKRTISLHYLWQLGQLAKNKPLRYRILLGDREAIQKQLGPMAIEV
jgi:predicted nucleotidyltransferase